MLKVVPAPPRQAGKLEPSFVKEAAAYARLAHPAIAKLYELFTAGDHLVLVFEHVDGRALNVVRAAMKRAGERLDDRAAIYVATRMFAGLAAAHAARDARGEATPVLHRDLNPSKVVLTFEGDVKLLSFAITKAIDVPRDSIPGFTWGSYGYLAPEQVRGERVTPRADVYSATVILWEQLTGKKAIDRAGRSDYEILQAMAAPAIEPLDALRPDLPAAVREAVKLGLEPVADRRAVTAEVMLGALREVIEASEGRALLASALERHKPDAEAAPKGERASHAGGAVATRAAPAQEAARAQVAPAQETTRGRAQVAPAQETTRVEPSRGSRPDEDPAERPGGYRMVATPIAVPVTSVPAPVVEPALPVAATAPVSASATVAVASPPARRGRAVRIALGVTMLAIVAGAAVLVARRDPRPTLTKPTLTTAAAATASAAAATPSAPSTSASASAAAATPSAPATSSASAPATTSPPAAAPPAASTGAVILPPSADGHRIFVDGRVVGEGRATLRVPCGARSIKIGSAGAPQTIDVPCGGEVALQR